MASEEKDSHQEPVNLDSQVMQAKEGMRQFLNVLPNIIDGFGILYVSLGRFEIESKDFMAWSEAVKTDWKMIEAALSDIPPEYQWKVISMLIRMSELFTSVGNLQSAPSEQKIEGGEKLKQFSSELKSLASQIYKKESGDKK